MHIQSLPQRSLVGVARQLPPTPPPQDPNQPEQPDPPSSSSSLMDNVKLGGVTLACSGVGVAGSFAHNIPYVGSTLSGVAGAIVGASAGACIAAALPGENIKVGALAGLVGGAILGATAGGTTLGHVALGVAGATIPFGLLMAVFSSAS